MELWKDNKFDPSATLWEGEVQLKICKNCGPLPLENFSDDGKYEKLCINCEAESRRTKDIKYDTSIRRKTATEARHIRQPWERFLRNAGQKFSSLPYTRQDLYEHLRNLYDTTLTHMNTYNSKVDSINNVFSKLDLITSDTFCSSSNSFSFATPNTITPPQRNVLE